MLRELCPDQISDYKRPRSGQAANLNRFGRTRDGPGQPIFRPWRISQAAS